MKTISVKLFSGLLFCFFLMAATSSYAQDNQVKQTKTSPASGPSVTPAAGGTKATKATPSSKPTAGSTAGTKSSKTYKTSAHFVRMTVTGGKIGAILRFEVSGTGIKTEQGEMRMSDDAGSRTKVLCYDKARDLSIKYSSDDSTLKVAFKDLKECK